MLEHVRCEMSMLGSSSMTLCWTVYWTGVCLCKVGLTLGFVSNDWTTRRPRGLWLAILLVMMISRNFQLCSLFGSPFVSSPPLPPSRTGITEICGESSSGKTQTVLHLCTTAQLPASMGGLGARKCLHTMPACELACTYAA